MTLGWKGSFSKLMISSGHIGKTVYHWSTVCTQSNGFSSLPAVVWGSWMKTCQLQEENWIIFIWIGSTHPGTSSLQWGISSMYAPCCLSKRCVNFILFIRTSAPKFLKMSFANGSYQKLHNKVTSKFACAANRVSLMHSMLCCVLKHAQKAGRTSAVLTN